jgi:pimeloyl-ACP methyl ester carboxylesterase
MIVIIDGTGPDNDQEYAKEMGNSFPSQIAKQVVGSTYFRGPSLTGKEVSSIADRAVGAAQGGSGSVILVGYSRGGCTAIIAAKRLKAQGKRVKAMFLFDAVDMQTSELGLSQTIPDNVDFVAHARTARDLAFWIRNPVKSRFYFYNTGRWLDGEGVLEEKKFTGTHGAAGGVPWADVVGDRACSLAVADWMTGQLKANGVDVTLKA